MPKTKNEWTSLLPEIDTAVEAIAKKHGLIFVRGTFRYDNSRLWGKIELQEPAAKVPGNGTKFTWNGNAYEFVRLNRRGYKYPIIATRISNGKNYKLPASARYIVETALGSKLNF